MVSIIIPAYNTEKYIAETINSVLNQTYKEWELIVVDDGSTDNTAKIVKAFCEKDNRIQYFYKENSGVSDTRNYGMEKAKGEYIVFLDSDDVWLNIFLEETLSVLKENENIGAVNTNVQFVDYKSNKTSIFYRGVTSSDINKLIFFELKNKTTGPSGTVVKTNLAKKINGFNKDLSNVADKMFYIDLSKITNIANIDKVLWYYRVHNDNMHKDVNNIISDFEKYFTILKQKEIIDKKSDIKSLKRIISKIILSECIRSRNIYCTFKYMFKYVF